MSFNVLDLFKEDGDDPIKAAANEYQGPCPGCGGTDRFCIYPDQNDKGDGHGPRGSYHCGHGTGGNGCGAAGDNIQYLRDFRGMSFKEACIHLGLEQGNKSDTASAYRAPVIPKESRKKTFVPAAACHPADVEDVAKWREHGEKFVQRCHEVLLKRQKSLDYLAGRGVSLEMVKKYMLGLHVGKKRRGEEWQPDFRPNVSWGIKGGINPKTKKQQVFALPAGLVIPWYGEGGLHRIRIRLAKPDKKNPKKKYQNIKGSSAISTWISRLDAKVYLVEETELDGILIEEKAGDLVGVIALGAVAIRPDAVASKALKEAIWILNASDFDKAGAKERAWWFEEFPNCRRWPVPVGKDPGEAFEKGVDIRAWVQAGLPPVMQSRDERTEKKSSSSESAIVSSDIDELLALLRESNGVVRIFDKGQSVTVDGDDDWTRMNREKARRMSSLVFTSLEVGGFLDALSDGIYTAKNLTY